MLLQTIALVALILLLPLQKRLCYLAAPWCQCPRWGGRACGTCYPQGSSLVSRAALWVGLWPPWRSQGPNNSCQVIPAMKRCLSDALALCYGPSRVQPLVARFALPAPAAVSQELEGFQQFGKLETNLKTFLLPETPIPGAEGSRGAARSSSLCSP